MTTAYLAEAACQQVDWNHITGVICGSLVAIVAIIGFVWMMVAP